VLGGAYVASRWRSTSDPRPCLVYARRPWLLRVTSSPIRWWNGWSGRQVRWQQA